MEIVLYVSLRSICCRDFTSSIVSNYMSGAWQETYNLTYFMGGGRGIIAKFKASCQTIELQFISSFHFSYASWNRGTLSLQRAYGVWEKTDVSYTRAKLSSPRRLCGRSCCCSSHFPTNGRMCCDLESKTLCSRLVKSCSRLVKPCYTAD